MKTEGEDAKAAPDLLSSLTKNEQERPTVTEDTMPSEPRKPTINKGMARPLAPNCSAYHDAVRAHGHASAEAKAVREQHAADPEFVEYADVLDALYQFEMTQRLNRGPVNPEPEPPLPWCEPGHDAGRLHRPITEDWLRDHGFRISDARGLHASQWVREVQIGAWTAEGQRPLGASDVLCIDIAPTLPRKPAHQEPRWHCWIVQHEPRRSIHVRHVRYTWEIAKLYEGLTGMVWPGTL